MCLASLALSLCGHHLLHAYHGRRLKTSAKMLYMCPRVYVYVHVCIWHVQISIFAHLFQHLFLENITIKFLPFELCESDA